ncbi:poly-gamma-glutamate biosynthesis protein [Lysinibacillus sp. 2017]|uniref:CapA family protein n=1 Tax=unclassified Lysinibacillus TaxID=2636778 RepID=UPI000D528ABD|nr:MULTISPECIES: CapA family protein [unclassified Lysinibacillus]AWE09227.1 poly-gamma-glutamate biosynthesis protein [Lysinibacillus sp. 2017]TGN37263.1 CapA family protein [Lysinibacillus sp. S2017]
MSKLNKFLLGVWVISLAVLVVVVMNVDKDHPFVKMAEGQGISEEVVESNLNADEMPVESEPELKPKQPALEPAPEPKAVPAPKPEPEPEPKPKPKPKPENMKESVRFAMIGDVLLHLRLAQYKDFTSSFQSVAPMLHNYDYLIANQESPPVGNKYALSGYPQFSSPQHIIRDIQKAGVDMVTIANNHIVDKGEGGVRTVFENLDLYNMPYVGVYKSNDDAAKPRIIELGSIKVGMLAYTYGTNGLYLPKGSSFKINYFDEAKIKADIEAIKEKVDVVAVSMHWGSEYVYEENDYQRHLTNVLNNAGVDIIFGTHPHVLQPYKKIVNEKGQETHVFYSLGNFFSTILTVPNSMIGGVASFEITKEGENVKIGKPQFDATSVLKDSDGIFRVYPLKEVEARSIKNLSWVKQIMGEDVTVN